MKKILILSLFLIIPFSIIPYADALLIGDNSTGGECNTVGMWNVTSRTCTLSSDINEEIVMGANLITLDGNGHNVTAPTPGMGDGVSIKIMFGITIENLTIIDFKNGIFLDNALDNSLINNTIIDSTLRGIFLDTSERNLIYGNFINGSTDSGIFVMFSDETLIENNSVINNEHGIYSDASDRTITKNNNSTSNNDFGIYLNNSPNSLIMNNTAKNNDEGINIFGSSNHTITGNLITENRLGGLINFVITPFIVTNNTYSNNIEQGLRITDSSPLQVYNNNFIGNPIQATSQFTSVIFSPSEETGGNYWGDYSPLCANVNNDNYCDLPYPFDGGDVNINDDFVWVLPDGWLTKFTGDADIVVNATSASGAIVNYSVSATLKGDPIPVTCDPVSGSLFPEGNSTVTCTAQNGIVTSFTITVNPFFIPDCLSPQNGNWVITEDCMLVNNSLIQGNVTVQGDTLLVITTDTTLSLPIGNKITIEQGAGVLIKSGGTFRIISGVNSASISIPQGTSVPGCEVFDECYIPYEVTVEVGSEVTWTNDDTAAHTVTAGSAGGGPTGEFDSSLFSAGTTFSHTFDTAGEIPYFCAVHPWMEGIVTVI